MTVLLGHMTRIVSVQYRVIRRLEVHISTFVCLGVTGVSFFADCFQFCVELGSKVKWDSC